MSARAYLDDVEEQLVQARRLLVALERELMPAGLHSGTTAIIDKAAMCQRLAAIDDRLHTALAKLGD